MKMWIGLSILLAGAACIEVIAFDSGRTLLDTVIRMVFAGVFMAMIVIGTRMIG